MHILLIHQAFASLDEPGGTRHHEFARYLVSKGHKVTVIASPVSYLTGSSSNRAEETIDGIRILRASTYVALHRSFVHRVFSFISFMVSSFLLGYKVKDVDVVWGTSPPIFQGITAYLLSRLKRAKFLFEVRDLWPDFAIAVGVLKNPILIAMSFWLEKFLYRHADAMMVNSPAYAPHVLSRGAKKVTLIPNGADPSMFNSKTGPNEFRQKNNLQGYFVVLYAGAHGISNDLSVVLDCAKNTANEPRILYVFVGDGKEKANLVDRATELDLSNVRFLPSVPKNEMSEVLSSADVCLAILKPLDEYKTTYPNKVFDYMAAGKPVLLAIDGVIREVVEKAACGIFTQPGDPQSMAQAVFTLFQKSEELPTIGELGRDYLIANFDREKIASELNELLVELISRS